MTNSELNTLTPQQAILAICLFQGNIAKEILSNLNKEHFDFGTNSRVFNAINHMIEKESEISIVSLGTFKKNLDITQKDIVSAVSWTSKLTMNENVQNIVNLVKDELIRKKLESQAKEIIENISSGSKDGLTIAIDTQTNIRSIIESESTISSVLTPQEMMSKEAESYDNRVRLLSEGKATGTPSGLQIIDKFTGGWQNGELIIIAGRPSMGKTALALFHTLKASEKGFPVLFFNMEMNESQLSQRLICCKAQGTINPQNLKLGKLTQSEIHDFTRYRHEIAEYPFLIYDKGGANIHEVIRAIKTAHRADKCKLVIIDYLQLIQSENKKGNREQEIAYISRTLKQTAKELDIPIIALSQLSRQVEQRGGNKKPILADLRESGAIEQDADTVLFCYRPMYYKLQKETGEEYTNEIFYLFEKHRTGATGEAEFLTDKWCSSFYDVPENRVSYLPEKPKELSPSVRWDSEAIEY
jgi:replicative DNA helicase